MNVPRIARSLLLATGACLAACGSSGGREAGGEHLGTAAAAVDPSHVQWDNGCSDLVSFTNKGGGPRPGPVTVVPLLWGFSDDASDRIGRLDVVYHQLESSNYWKWLQLEYGAPAMTHLTPRNDPTFTNAQRDVAAATAAAMASGNISWTQLTDTLAREYRYGGLPNVPNPIFVIHLPPHVTSDNGTQMCVKKGNLGYNSYKKSFDLWNGGWQTLYYVVVPDESTCQGVPFRGITEALSHELAENATDPMSGTGWTDSTQPSSCGYQIGDLCAGISSTIDSSFGYTNPSTGVTDYTLTVQKLWSNQSASCVTEDDSTSPTVTGMSPQSGVAGTVVTITGTNFEGHPIVTFGGIRSTNVSCPSSTLCTAVVPAGPGNTPAYGTVPVYLTNNNTSLAPGQFAYPPAPPPEGTPCGNGYVYDGNGQCVYIGYPCSANGGVINQYGWCVEVGTACKSPPGTIVSSSGLCVKVGDGCSINGDAPGVWSSTGQCVIQNITCPPGYAVAGPPGQEYCYQPTSSGSSGHGGGSGGGVGGGGSGGGGCLKCPKPQ
jgi:hypothetical protein